MFFDLGKPVPPNLVANGNHSISKDNQPVMLQLYVHLKVVVLILYRLVEDSN